MSSRCEICFGDHVTKDHQRAHMPRCQERAMIQAFAINAEIAGMQALNQHRLSLDQSIGYNEEAFFAKAEELNRLSKSIGDCDC